MSDMANRKFYCIESYPEALTEGKVYETNAKGQIAYDGGPGLPWPSEAEWRRCNRLATSCLVPLVKRAAKVGEWVYVCAAFNAPLNDDGSPAYKNGDILKIIFMEDDYARFRKGHDMKNRRYVLAPSEYLVLDGYQPEEATKPAPPKPSPQVQSPDPTGIAGHLGVQGVDGNPAEFSRAAILDAAKQIVTSDREEQYGAPEDNFKIIAELWEIYIRTRCAGKDADIRIESRDVAMMMCLLKVARTATSDTPKADNFIDLAGYAACGAELAGKGTEA